MPARVLGASGRARTSAWLACGAVLAFACSEESRPPRADYVESDRHPPSSGVPLPGPGREGCGEEEITALVDLPRLYFVLDRSGSMAEPLPGEAVNKWRAAQTAVAGLLRTLGHRVEYGAAVFPGSSDACLPGHQAFPFTQGDPPNRAAPNRNGPTLQALMSRLSVLDPEGGTPTAATLAEIRPLVTGASVPTYVVLATDGAPNCNTEASCGVSSCIPDIEHANVDGALCGEDFSCCDPEVLGPDAGANCVDEDATLVEVSALADAGVPTYVIGMPGANEYQSLLDRLAEAGGTARSGSPKYYAVADATDLNAALLEIGTGAAIECELTLAEVPADASLVNVYYDGQVVGYDEVDGWVWDGDTQLVFRGAACDELRSGSVLSVSIVYGCTTVIE